MKTVLAAGWFVLGQGVCPIDSSTDVVIFHGTGPAASCKSWEEQFYEWLGLNVATLTNLQMKDADCGGKMKDFGVKLFVMPGGNAYNTQRALHAEGRDNINNFINRGGTYIGTCAGFYLAASEYWWQGVKYSWPNMLGQVPIVEGSIVDIHDYDVSPGYGLTTLDNGLKSVYWGGPTRGWRNTSASGFPGTVLARFADANDLAAAYHVTSSNGNLLLFSPHLEAVNDKSVEDSGLTDEMQLANWQYRAREITKITGLNIVIPSVLLGHHNTTFV